MSETPRTDATCKALVAMLEPLRGGSRVTDAEMKAIEGMIAAFVKCSVELERDLAAEKLAREADNDKWNKHSAEWEERANKALSDLAAREAEQVQASEELARVKAAFDCYKSDYALHKVRMARVVKAEAEREEAVRDAARYRWLRDESWKHDSWSVKYCVIAKRGNGLDEAIDAAIDARDGK